MHLFGTVKPVHRRLPPPDIPYETLALFHAYEPVPSQSTGVPIRNDADSVSYCLHQFILPIFRILKVEFPHLPFFVSSEVTLSVEVHDIEDKDPDEDSESRRVATARVDMVIKYARGFEDPVIVLLLEQK